MWYAYEEACGQYEEDCCNESTEDYNFLKWVDEQITINK